MSEMGELQAQAEIARLTEQRDALLKACEAALNYLVHQQYEGTHDAPYIAQLRAAIAKADAEEPYLPWVV